jgi:hypothetical protein
MPEKLEARPGKTKTWIFAGIGGIVALGGLCLCGGLTVGLPAFEKYVRKSKAIEAESHVQSIAVGAKAHFETDCSFPPAAGPLPPLLDCCEETCRRTEKQMKARGWQAVGFDTNQPHRFEYQTLADDDHYVVRARADLDCDGERSLYQVELTGDRDACTATIGELAKEQPFE